MVHVLYRRGEMKHKTLGPSTIWVVVKTMVPFWVPEILGAVL